MNLDIEKIKAALEKAFKSLLAHGESWYCGVTVSQELLFDIKEALASIEAYDPDMTSHACLTCGRQCPNDCPMDKQSVPDAIMRDNIRLAEKLRQYLPHCGKQDMTNGDRELVEWVEAIMNAGKE